MNALKVIKSSALIFVIVFAASAAMAGNLCELNTKKKMESHFARIQENKSLKLAPSNNVRAYKINGKKVIEITDDSNERIPIVFKIAYQSAIGTEGVDLLQHIGGAGAKELDSGNFSNLDGKTVFDIFQGSYLGNSFGIGAVVAGVSYHKARNHMSDIILSNLTGSTLLAIQPELQEWFGADVGAEGQSFKMRLRPLAYDVSVSMKGFVSGNCERTSDIIEMEKSISVDDFMGFTFSE